MATGRELRCKLRAFEAAGGKRATIPRYMPAAGWTISRPVYVYAQLDLWKNKDTNKIGVYRLPKHLDEEVARLHLERIGVKLTKLTKAQADYLGVPVEGPYKPEHYRY